MRTDEINKYQKQKHLQINIAYYTSEDLQGIMKKITHLCKEGIQSHKRAEHRLFYEYNINYIQEPNARIETINGKACLVIPSKLHEI